MAKQAMNHAAAVSPGTTPKRARKLEKARDAQHKAARKVGKLRARLEAAESKLARRELRLNALQARLQAGQERRQPAEAKKRTTKKRQTAQDRLAAIGLSSVEETGHTADADARPVTADGLSDQKRGARVIVAADGAHTGGRSRRATQPEAAQAQAETDRAQAETDDEQGSRA